jgi:hypothetical protein
VARLFLYASLAEVEIAPTYIAAIIKTLLETVVGSAADAGLPLPSDRALIQELGWVLHGNVRTWQSAGTSITTGPRCRWNSHRFT